MWCAANTLTAASGLGSRAQLLRAFGSADFVVSCEGVCYACCGCVAALSHVGCLDWPRRPFNALCVQRCAVAGCSSRAQPITLWPAALHMSPASSFLSSTESWVPASQQPNCLRCCCCGAADVTFARTPAGTPGTLRACGVGYVRFMVVLAVENVALAGDHLRLVRCVCWRRGV